MVGGDPPSSSPFFMVLHRVLVAMPSCIRVASFFYRCSALTSSRGTSWFLRRIIGSPLSGPPKRIWPLFCRTRRSESLALTSLIFFWSFSGVWPPPCLSWRLPSMITYFPWLDVSHHAWGGDGKDSDVSWASKNLPSGQRRNNILILLISW